MRFAHILVALLAVRPLASCDRAAVPQPRADAPAAPVMDSAPRSSVPDSGTVTAVPASGEAIAVDVGFAPTSAVRAECDTIAMLAVELLERPTSQVTADTVFHEELMQSTRRGCVVAVSGTRRDGQPGTYSLARQLQDRGWPSTSRVFSDGSTGGSFILWRPTMICSFSINGYDAEDPAALSDPGREWFLARCANEMPGDAAMLAPLSPDR